MREGVDDESHKGSSGVGGFLANAYARTLGGGDPNSRVSGMRGGVRESHLGRRFRFDGGGERVGNHTVTTCSFHLCLPRVRKSIEQHSDCVFIAQGYKKVTSKLTRQVNRTAVQLRSVIVPILGPGIIKDLYVCSSLLPLHVILPYTTTFRSHHRTFNKLLETSPPCSTSTIALQSEFFLLP